MNYILKSIIYTSIIFWMIGFGTILNNGGYHFWGIFNCFVGGIAVYYLSLKFFENEVKK